MCHSKGSMVCFAKRKKQQHTKLRVVRNRHITGYIYTEILPQSTIDVLIISFYSVSNNTYLCGSVRTDCL